MTQVFGIPPGAGIAFACTRQAIRTKGRTDGDPDRYGNDLDAARALESFFETKTACDVEGMMAYFAPARARADSAAGSGAVTRCRRR
jgi:hypothetical protein